MYQEMNRGHTRGFGAFLQSQGVDHPRYII